MLNNMSRSTLLASTIKKLPNSPGVYFLKNKQGEIIYIGKASNLKNRVSSYFYKKVKFYNATKIKMLSEITNIEILKTASEIEALIKESELIKKHKPKFNVLMRDSKNYLFQAIRDEAHRFAISYHRQLHQRTFTSPFRGRTSKESDQS